jgi:hypothetical protein
MNRDIISLYSQGQQGGELPYFVGKQYGSGWLRTLARLAFPILQRFGKVAVNTARDVFTKNKSVLPTIKEHALDAVKNVLAKVANAFRSDSPESHGSNESHKTSKQTINKRRKVQNTIFT